MAIGLRRSFARPPGRRRGVEVVGHVKRLAHHLHERSIEVEFKDEHARYGTERDEEPAVGKLKKLAFRGGSELEVHIWTSAGAGTKLREIDAALSSVAAAEPRARGAVSRRPRAGHCCRGPRARG